MTHRALPLIALLGSAALLAACQTTGTAPAPISEAPAPAFVEAACGGCHAVEPPFISPNPAVPSFEAIANREGLTEETLADWLANAHNYPEEMECDLTREQVDEIAAYMVTLRRDDYEPEE